LEETPANPLLKQEVTSQPGGWKGKGKEEKNGIEVTQLTDCGCTYGSWQIRQLSILALLRDDKF